MEYKFRIWDGIKIFYQDDINWIDFKNGYVSVLDEYNYADNCAKEISIGEFNLTQFTGKKDMKGKEIYTKDIVRCTNPSGRVLIGEIKFKYGYYGVESDLKVVPLANILSPEIEVIGNMYENEGLLNKWEG